MAYHGIGELASGLAILTALEKQKGVRGIPTSIRCEYYKKARGLIVVTGIFSFVKSTFSLIFKVVLMWWPFLSHCVFYIRSVFILPLLCNLH